MVGVEYPIISQDDIHNFFLVHKGKEFIGYDRADLNYLDRIRYYYFWNKYARAKNIVKKWLFLKGIQFVRLQKRLGINRIKNDPLEYKKGYANWSITDGLARFIVGQEDFIKIRMGRTHCADEVFFHTLAFNSPYAKNIYDFNNEYKSCMRLTTWKNSNNRFGLNDIDMILDSGKIFARKIDGPDALDLINAIRNRRRKTDKIL